MASDILVRMAKEEEEEEEENERVREDIISSLPWSNGWINDKLYHYQGFWYDHMVLKGIMFVQEHFKAHSTDILVATNPKCGTTWLNALAFAILNRSKYPISISESESKSKSKSESGSEFEMHPLLTTNSHRCVFGLEHEVFLKYVYWAEIENQPSPRLYGTHIPYTSLPESIESSGCRIVYLYRNPQDLLVSLWHFLDKFKDKERPRISLPEAFESFCRGDSPFGPYWDHVLGYYKARLKFPDRILLLNYENLQRDTCIHVKRLADFFDCPFSLEEEAKGVVQDIVKLCSFETMSNLEVNKKQNVEARLDNDAFFRKGQVGDSKNYLTAEMMEILENITTEKFQGTGLSLYTKQ